jgi:hypothetical protein
MNLDALRSFVVFDGKLERRMKTRSIFRIRYQLCGWPSRRGELWARGCELLWNIFDIGRNSETIRNLRAMTIYNYL